MAVEREERSGEGLEGRGLENNLGNNSLSFVLYYYISGVILLLDTKTLEKYIVVVVVVVVVVPEREAIVSPALPARPLLLLHLHVRVRLIVDSCSRESEMDS